MAAIGQGQVQLRQFLRALHGGNGTHRLLSAADITASAGRLDLHDFEAARHIQSRYAQARHALGI